MLKGFFAETLANRPVLWKAILRANAGQAENKTAWNLLSDEKTETLLRWLQERPPVVHSVSEAVPVPCGFWDFAEESRRLALLDEQALHRLCRVTGTALYAPVIAGVLRRDDVLALRAQLGEDMYHYALYRGRYELGGVRRFFSAVGHPAFEILSLGQRCTQHGCLALRLIAAGWPDVLSSQFIRRLADFPEDEELPELDTRERNELWRAVKKLLLKEVAPSWAPCFD